MYAFASELFYFDYKTNIVQSKFIIFQGQFSIRSAFYLRVTSQGQRYRSTAV